MAEALSKTEVKSVNIMILHELIAEASEQGAARALARLGLDDPGASKDIALWTGGSWRFQVPSEGMTVRNRQTGTDMVWIGTSWISAPIIMNPQSGAVVDVEARAAVVELLSYLRMTGRIES